jgi:site-specific recombinase XerD
MHLSALGEFLAYLRERNLTLKAVCPSDVGDFLRTRLKKFRRQYGRLPKDADSWRHRYTGPIRRLLRIIFPSWPPLKPPGSARERFHRELLQGYGHWLTEVHGLSEKTLYKNSRIARVFLLWLKRRADRESLPLLSITDIDGYLAWRMPGLRRASRYGECQCLRSFLRYLHAAKLLRRDLSVAVSGPIIYKYDEIPRAFTEAQIKTLLAVARRDRSSQGFRDYAILLLLATYGLRAGEVAWLRLEDIDWRREYLRIRRSKTGGESFLPLVPSVGRALLNYLKQGRPKTRFREIFLRVRAPLKPFSTVSPLDAIILSRMKEAGIEVRGRHGTHAFRFARAMSMLRASVSLKSIGDLLGHSSAASTEVYLRLESNDLRAISLEVPGKEPDANLARQRRIAAQ